jgi:hypothetical protein
MVVAFFLLHRQSTCNDARRNLPSLQLVQPRTIKRCSARCHHHRNKFPIGYTRMEFLPGITPTKTFLPLCLIILSLCQKTKTTRTVTTHTQSSYVTCLFLINAFVLQFLPPRKSPLLNLYNGLPSFDAGFLIDRQQPYLATNFPSSPLSSSNRIFQEIFLPRLYQV